MCLAIPGRLVEVRGGEGFERRGLVDYGGVQQDVSLAYVPDAQVGDYVLVHVGYAMTRMDSAAARKLLRELETEPPLVGEPPEEADSAASEQPPAAGE